MARQESDREDLMREATAIKRRLEVQCPGFTEPIIAGFRSDGSLSIYFSSEPVYQFNPRGQLRRAFWQGDLLRSQGNTLARLHRTRTETKTELIRHDMNQAELADFRGEMQRQLTQFRDAIADQHCNVIQQVPESGDLIVEIQAALTGILDNRSDWLAPRFRGK